MNTDNPFKLLLDIEQHCKQTAAELPSAVDAEERWVGVGFRVGDDKLIASMSDVEEILDVPECTKVPGAKSWIIGLANVRGNLLPMIDLKGFIIGEDMKQRKKGRVIVIDYRGFNTGLVVDEVYGMRHFLLKDRVDESANVHDRLLPYTDKVFKQEGESWPVFNFESIVKDERFTLASL